MKKKIPLNNNVDYIPVLYPDSKYPKTRFSVDCVELNRFIKAYQELIARHLDAVILIKDGRFIEALRVLEDGN